MTSDAPAAPQLSWSPRVAWFIALFPCIALILAGLLFNPFVLTMLSSDGKLMLYTTQRATGACIVFLICGVGAALLARIGCRRWPGLSQRPTVVCLMFAACFTATLLLTFDVLVGLRIPGIIAIPWLGTPDAVLQYRNTPGVHPALDHHATINSRGYRMHEFEARRPAGIGRVAILGDSVTYGWGVRDEHTIPAQLAEQLSTPEKKTEVLNLAASGYSFVQYAYLIDEAISYQPDHLFVLICLNDLMESQGRVIPTGDERVGYVVEPSLLRRVRWWIKRHSGIVNARAILFPPHKFSTEAELISYSETMIKTYMKQEKDRGGAIQMVEIYMRRVARQAKDANIPLTFLITPYRFQVDPKTRSEYEDPDVLQRELSEAAKRVGVPVVDLTPKVMRWVEEAGGDPTKLYFDYDHFNNVGCGLIAAEIAALITGQPAPESKAVLSEL